MADEHSIGLLNEGTPRKVGLVKYIIGLCVVVLVYVGLITAQVGSGDAVGRVGMTDSDLVAQTDTDLCSCTTTFDMCGQSFCPELITFFSTTQTRSAATSAMSCLTPEQLGVLSAPGIDVGDLAACQSLSYLVGPEDDYLSAAFPAGNTECPTSGTTGSIGSAYGNINGGYQNAMRMGC